MNTRTTLAVTGALILAPILLSACGGDDGQGSTDATPNAGSPSASGSMGAVDALGGLGSVQRGRPLSEWIAEIDGDDRFKTYRAINVVADMEKRGLPAVPSIRARLLDPATDDGVKKQAMRALGRIGGPDGIAALLKTMVDEGEIIGVLAADALGALGLESAEALTPYLKHKNPEVRNRTGRALKGALAAQGRGGQLDVAIIPLAEALTDPDQRVRQWAMQILSELGARAASAKPFLVAQLGEEIPSDQRALILVILGLMGPEAADAITEIRACTTHEQPTVRLMAGLALAQVGAIDEGIALLTELIEHEKQTIRMGAADAFRRIGPPAASAIPVLKEARRGASEQMHLLLDQALRSVQGRP